MLSILKMYSLEETNFRELLVGSLCQTLSRLIGVLNSSIAYLQLLQPAQASLYLDLLCVG